MSATPRVLWVTPELPYWPGGSGGSTRQHQLIVQLLARGHEVVVAAPIHPDQEDGARLLRATGATLHGVPRPPSRVREVLGTVRARPAVALDALRMPLLAWQVEVFWTSLRDRVRSLLADPATRPDVILVEHDWAARWARDLDAAGVPKILALENLSWAYHRNRATTGTGLARVHNALEARRFERFDRRELTAYDLLLAMSASDQEQLRAVVPTASAIVPNGVDTGALVASPLPSDPVSLYTGTMAYPPNAEGLGWLLRDIWPRVAEQVDGARLLVVGRGVPDDLAALAGDDVEFAGWVDAMQPWFDRARTVLVPILSGGGTRLKVLDGLASGRPIVSTTMGAEGIDVRDGEHVRIADEPQAFADATAALLRDGPDAARLGAAGRRLAEDVYDWHTIGTHLADIVEALAAGTAPPGVR